MSYRVSGAFIPTGLPFQNQIHTEPFVLKRKCSPCMDDRQEKIVMGEIISDDIGIQ